MIAKEHVFVPVIVGLVPKPDETVGIVVEQIMFEPIFRDVWTVGVVSVGVVKLGLVSVLFVRVCVAARVTTVSDAPGKVIVVESVPASVSVFDTEKVLALVRVNVPVEAVRVKPLMVVAVAAPMLGVVITQLVTRQRFPVPD